MKPVLLPTIAHRCTRMVLSLAGNMRGAWRLRRFVTDVERTRFPEGLIRTKLEFGQPLWIDPNDSMARHIFYFGLWEPAVATHFYTNLREGDNVLDVGANIGQYAVLACSRVGQRGRVFAVEPGPVRDILRRNIALNSSGRTETLAFAAWDRNETLYLSPGDSNTNGLAYVVRSANDGSFREVPARRLDHELRERKCLRIDVIKLDVEGAELPALRGLSELFNVQLPRAVYCEVEHEHTQKYDYKPSDLVSYLGNYGYSAKVFLHHGKGLVDYDPEAKEDPARSNMVLFARHN